MQNTAQKIVKKIKDAGFTAVYAGGFVRDSLLHLPAKDIDIATNAKPEQIEALFTHTLPLGKAFGVITVLEKGHSFEIATFRKDGVYQDGRHPESVEFCEMQEDARRRDFTINGVFYDPISREIIDFVGGQEDLEHGIIRFIGDPKERIHEDKLRMLRAIRFACRYNFEIEPFSMKAIWNNASSVVQVSIERIREEVFKILCSPYPSRGLQLLSDSGLLAHILPEVFQLQGVEQGLKYHWKEARVRKIINKYLELGSFEPFDPTNPEHLDSKKYMLYSGDVWEHTKLVVSHTPAELELRMAALLHDISKPQTFQIRKGRPTFHGHEGQGAVRTKEILQRLKCPNDFIENVVWLVANHMRFFQISNMKKATLIRLFRHPLFKKLCELHRADIKGSNGDLSLYEYAIQKYEELKDELSPKALLNGDSLIALGFTPSPLYRTILKNVETLQLEGTLKTREEAIAYALTYK